MIRVVDLYKSFESRPVLEGISLEVMAGELVFILGVSGSGKSVLLQHLIGLMKPDRGSVEIEGADITMLGERELLKVRRQIGYLFQEGALYDFMTVFENVAFPLSEHTRLRAKQIEQKVFELLELVGLQDDARKYPSQLSGGMKKRAALARSVILDSKILLCDEPTSGLDPIRSREISDLIADITRKIKCTTVVTSHDIHNSFRLADRLALIQSGRIVLQGQPDALRLSENEFVKEILLCSR